MNDKFLGLGRLPGVPKADAGGIRMGATSLVTEIRDLATGLRRRIRQGRTGEVAIREWERRHGDINEPAFLRKKRQEEVSEV